MFPHADGAITCRSRILMLAAILSAGVGSSGRAANSSLEERVAILEGHVVQLSSENQALRARLAGGSDRPSSAGVLPEGRAAKISLGGLMQVQGESSGAPDSRYTGLSERFQLRRMRVALAGMFAEGIAFKFETDFGNASISGRSGAAGQITDATVTWTRYAACNLRAGQFKTPFGYEQLVSDPKTTFVERSLANDRSTIGRQIGIQASGDIVKSVLGYAAGVFNGSGTNNGANDNSKFMSVGRLVATIYTGTAGGQPVRWTAAANSFNTVDKGGFTGRRTGYGVDSQLNWGPAQVGAEWLRNDNHPVTGLPLATAGWYAFGAWNFDRSWQGAVRFDVYDSALHRRATTTREWTLGLNHFLKGDDLKLMLNYQLGNPPAPLPRAGRWLGRMQVVF
jgi:hypothetical protein